MLPAYFDARLSDYMAGVGVSRSEAVRHKILLADGRHPADAFLQEQFRRITELAQMIKSDPATESRSEQWAARILELAANATARI
jgi:hypothetical protein